MVSVHVLAAYHGMISRAVHPHIQRVSLLHRVEPRRHEIAVGGEAMVVRITARQNRAAGGAAESICIVVPCKERALAADELVQIVHVRNTNFWVVAIEHMDNLNKLVRSEGA